MHYHAPCTLILASLIAIASSFQNVQISSAPRTITPSLHCLKMEENANDKHDGLISTNGGNFGKMALKRHEFVYTLGTLISSATLLPSASIGYPPYPQAWKTSGNPKSYKTWAPQVRDGYKRLEIMVENWDEIAAKDNGDEMRRFLGTVGVSSSLTSFKKALYGVRDAVDLPSSFDEIEWAEKAEEVVTCLGDAENDFYSANFAEFSGGGQLKSAQFIKKARPFVKKAYKIVGGMVADLPEE
uniref:Uncharacterized protein n=1 Tax=Fibrocapsa japonica TaxID=94617 RepID=A0A7S2UXU3_9STRA|mmetsp:Transcript_14233/g.20949  ORF Transcript_14233/g.20949 Transcript_14233/m.20949 type:complete len:242 (+) Transcript_14233:104-829(+)